MKKQIDFKLIAIFVGGLLFNFLFWMERLALNLLLYSIFIFLMFLLDKAMPKSKKMLLIGASHLLAGLLVLYNQSNLTLAAWYISLAVFVGFAHAQLIRSIFTAVLSFLLHLFTSPVRLIQRIISVRIGNFSLKPLGKPIKYIVLPLFILFLFTALYSSANEVFAKYLNQLTDSTLLFLNNIYSFFFADLSFARVMHAIAGVVLTAGILIGIKDNGVEKIELKCEEQLLRNRKRNKNTFFHEVTDLFLGTFINKKLALKTENIIGVLCFAMLNLLLLFLNTIDLTTLWLNSQHLAPASYSAELHDGTNALIFSIVLAMVVILYFFNGNLNFYSKNKTLKTLAIIWIVQNTFLLFSVALRDYNYITVLGLTYKRIGVVVFLLLCSIGLITVYIKVIKQKTFFYLFKANGLAWYVLLFAFCLVNWDVFIVDYNIRNQKATEIDIDHLSDLSDKTLPLLDKNRKLLSASLKGSSYWPRFVTDTAGNVAKTDTSNVKPNEQQEAELDFNKQLDSRITVFKERWDKSTWLSWNYRDWQTHEYFR